MRILWITVVLAGCATTPGAPAPTAEELAAQEAAAAEAQRQAWLESHRETLHELTARAEALAGAKDRIFDTTTSWRVDPALLADAQTDCPLILSELMTLAEAIDGHVQESGFESLPLLPADWGTAAAVGAHRRALGQRCDSVPALISQRERAEATKAEAVAAREAMTKRTKTAADALSEADRVLRDIVGDDTFDGYLDALDGWQQAATTALREERKPDTDPDRLAAARRDEAAAKGNYDARMAGITLEISGRSTELTDAVDAAVKQLKRLQEADRAAVLGLFPPEVTPASSILLQLVDQRM